jgi:histidine triad (HIT) family protein
MEDCIFCKIAKKEVSSRIVLESDNIIVFPDISPKAEFHLLIIPKKHIEHFAAIEEEDVPVWNEMVDAAKKLIFENGLVEKGYRLVVNGGPAAHIKHLHLHLLGGVGVQNRLV